jgi:dipeptidyl aminopeptidase/acylaminoacyl peptidase
VEFVLVDAIRGTRQSAFDHARLAAALSNATGDTYVAERLPFRSIAFLDDGKAIAFPVGDTTWQCDVSSYTCIVSDAPITFESDEDDDDRGRSGRRRRRSASQGNGDTDQTGTSPDGKWTAIVKDNNVFIKSSADAQEFQLSTDGTDSQTYGQPIWAPDSKTVVAFRIEPGERLEVYRIQSSPPGGGRAKLETSSYALPGDRFTTYELNLFDVEQRSQLKPNVDRFEHEWQRPRPRWNRDGHRFSYLQTDRGHQRVRVIEVDSHNGQVRNLIDEKSDTFIWTAHTENLDLSIVNWLEQSDELIYVSERSGWRHLYLVDADSGEGLKPITAGQWVVRGIDRIDEANRQVWFSASGVYPDQDPYFIHYGRTNFDGSGLVWLTAGNGTHRVQFSDDRKFLIDTYSRVDCPPINELRRASDGQLVCQLETADITQLTASGWRPPEVFVAKGRDGATDIWGNIYRPRDFDPSVKYPVIEDLYAGPQDSFVPKAFNSNSPFDDLTQLGFIVVKIDGMGTANRSKAFHDVCWHNLRDGGLPDRILWMKAATAKYPSMDLSRVGVYGVSAGGQTAAGALLFHPEFYQVAVAACGCHDNRMDKASWNEQWMGYPVGPQYAECSNIENAHRLQGKLLLIVGELDNNVPPESTMRFVDALVRADKDFELLVVPNDGHGIGGSYGRRRMHDFFVRHLRGERPSDKRSAEFADDGKPQVVPPPESFFASVKDDDRDAARRFYTKFVDVRGLPVVAGADVEDLALQRTHELVTHLLAGRPDILQAMVQQGTRLVVIGKDQVYTDMPEYRNHPNPTFQNERVRGTGGLDVTSFGEENLLNLPLDRYDDESIAVHEFCHTIDAALRRIDPSWRERLAGTYENAVSKGLWKNAYAASNPGEYWAEICQSYFDCNRVNNWNHGPVGTREQLKQYDPEGYELVKTTFNLSPENDWRYKPLRVQPSVTSPPSQFATDAYYTKFTYAREFPVLGSDRVDDSALLRANEIIRRMFAYRHDILKAMIADGARLVVLGRQEKLSDLPEFRDARNQAAFDEVRYLDYSPSLKLMVVPEENVLGLPGDPLAGRCMVLSVFAKALHQVTGLRPVDSGFEQRRGKQQYELRVRRMDVEFDRSLQSAYSQAMSKQLWKGTAASAGHLEYWVAGVEAYFDAGGDGQPPELADRSINTREALQVYDPDLFRLVEETMAYKGHVDWRISSGR